MENKGEKSINYMDIIAHYIQNKEYENLFLYLKDIYKDDYHQKDFCLRLANSIFVKLKEEDFSDEIINSYSEKYALEIKEFSPYILEGLIYYRSQVYDKAIASLYNSLEEIDIDSNPSEAYYTMSHIFCENKIHRNHLKISLKYINLALVNNKSFKNYLLKSLIYSNMGKENEAKECFIKSEELKLIEQDENN